MRSITDTIARLHPQPAKPATDRLSDLTAPFANPGALRARLYLPETLMPGAPLVVVLHGCTQTAAGYDHGSGWSAVADANGFALLLPEQVGANNPNRCFNWFLPADTTRGQGEAASIAAMIAAAVARHDLDPARVFVTGLSAGGAMTATMLATYPELFAGGAIIAGLPHGVATSVPQALDRMRGQGLPDTRVLARAVRDGSSHSGAFPPVAVWHGGADMTVAPATGEAVVAQWLGVHGLSAIAAEEDTVDGHAHRLWRDAQGRVAVESHVIAGMGHGTPLDPDACGVAGPYMLDVGSSSTLRIAERWGIAAARPERLRRPAAAPSLTLPGGKGVGKVIEDALRTAGLMH